MSRTLGESISEAGNSVVRSVTDFIFRPVVVILFIGVVIIFAIRVYQKGVMEAFNDFDGTVLKRCKTELDKKMSYDSFVDETYKRYGVEANSRNYMDFQRV